MPILAAMGEREARGIGKAARRAMDDLRHYCQRADGTGAHAGHEQQLGEIGRTAFRSGGERAVQATHDYVACTDIVMRGHDEMGQQRLLWRGPRRGLLLKRRERADDPVRPEIAQKIELAAARSLGPAVGEVDDLALSNSVDRRMWRFDEARQIFGKPMIAARLTALAVHALLHHDPAPVVGDDETVKIEVKAVLHRGAVDCGDEPTRLGQRHAVEADAFADRQQLLWRLPGMPAAPAADMDAEFAR